MMGAKYFKFLVTLRSGVAVLLLGLGKVSSLAASG
jgi:hypothetical protein